MNKVFKVIWNEARSAYVVVSEMAKSHGTKSCSTKKLLAMLIATGVMTCASVAPVMAANPASKDTKIEVGKDAKAKGGDSVAIGNGAEAKAANGIAIGYKSLSGDRGCGVAVGGNTQAIGTYSVALGQTAKVLEYEGIAIGHTSLSEGSGAIAIGKSTNAKGTASLAFGNDAKALEEASIAFGQGSNSSGNSSIAVGRGANATGQSSIAIGSQAVADKAYSVVIGANTYKGTTGTGVTGVGQQTQVLGDYAGAFGMGAKANAERATAIGSYANAMAAGSVALGAGSTVKREAGAKGYDPLTGKESTLTSFAWKSTKGAVSVGGVGVTRQIINVAAGSEDADAVNVAQLKKVNEEALKHTTLSDGKNTTVVPTVKDGQTDYKVNVAGDLTDISSVANGDAKLALNGAAGTAGIVNGKGASVYMQDGYTVINSKVSFDQDGKISGVAAGAITADSTDAVNGSQLKETNDRVTNVENDVKNIQGDITNIKGDITTIKGDVTNLGDRVTNVEKTAGKHSSVSTTDSNLRIDSTGTNNAGGIDYQVSLKNDLKLDSVTTGDTKMDTNGVTVKDVSLTKDGLSIGDKTYVSKDGLNANNQTITNVADGKVEKDSKDAVNGGQLYETNQAIANNATNISSLSHSISNLDNRVNKVGAGAAALAALHPLDFDPDAKWDFAAGYGNYRGTNAAAVGAYYRPNEDTMFSVGGTFGNGENMVNAGVSFKLGSGSSHVSTSRVAMAKEIKELRGELEAMKSAMLDANAGKKIDTSKLQLFPDVPQNHWAYEYVTQLAGNGMIEGYPDGNFAGDRPMTRYEFAAILYRAMTKGAVLSDKILSEFSHELEYFTVDTVAKDKAGNPTIQRVRTVKANTNK